MKFDIQKKIRPFKFPQEEIQLARKFSEKIYKEFGDFVKAVVLFGSTSRMEDKVKDVDILVILDDVHIMFSEELIQTYRIIVEKIIADLSPDRLHIQSMKWSSFWEYVRVGDPVAINVLRFGIALIDTGFFDPLQALLDQGRIRPTEEAIHTYFTMAPASLHRSKQHMLTAMVDLYWAAIDSAHAALMAVGEIPPTPDHVADLLDQKLARRNLIRKRDAQIMREMYSIFKKITHREIKEVSGKDLDKYRALTQEFVMNMQRFIEKNR